MAKHAFTTTLDSELLSIVEDAPTMHKCLDSQIRYTFLL